MAELIALKFHPCRISRKGKAAKGTVTVKTLGVPVVNTDGIAKDWRYEQYRGMPLDRFVSQLRDLTKANDAMLVEAFCRGWDMGEKVESIRTGSESALLANRIYSMGLSIDKDEAERLAVKWIANIKFAAENDIEITVDTLLEKRITVVDKLKAEGVWSTKADKLAPRLVDNRPKVEVDDTDTESDDSDSDDSDEQ